MLTLLLATTTAAAATEQDGTYALPDVGVTLRLPGWHMSRWSDWDFRGRTQDGSVLISAWSTPFELPIDTNHAEGVREAWRKKLVEEEGASDVAFGSSKVSTIDGRPTLLAEATITLPGGTKAVFEGAAFATQGHTAYVGTYAASSNAGRALAARERALASLSVEKAASQPSTGGLLEHPMFTLDLPAGWRAPLESESFDASGLYTRTGVKDPAACAVAINPVAPGQADVLLACTDGPKLTIVDQYSFDDESILFASGLFGKAASTLSRAEPLETKSGLAILQRAKEGLYVAGLPYRDGTLVAWVAGEAHRDAEIVAAARSTLSTWTLTDVAVPQPSFGATVAHVLAYRPTHPAVLAAAALAAGILGMFAKLIFARPRMELPSDQY